MSPFPLRGMGKKGIKDPHFLRSFLFWVALIFWGSLLGVHLGCNEPPLSLLDIKREQSHLYKHVYLSRTKSYPH